MLQQVDKPRHMYDNPANMFVAGFIGSPAMNLFELPVNGSGPTMSGYAFPVPREALSSATSGSVTVGVRPENLQVVGDGQGVQATVLLVEELGSDAFVHASVPQDTGEVVLVARVDPKLPPEKGDAVHLAPVDSVHVCDTATGRRLTH